MDVKEKQIDQLKEDLQELKTESKEDLERIEQKLKEFKQDGKAGNK